MTGLLARMAARAAGEAPVAAPRIPTRFEPLPEEMGLPEPAMAADGGNHGEAPAPVAPPTAQPMPAPSAPMPPTPHAAPAFPVAPVATAPAAMPPRAPALPAAAPLPAPAVQRREMLAPSRAAEGAAATSSAAADAAAHPEVKPPAASLRIEVPGATRTAARSRRAGAAPLAPAAVEPTPLGNADPAHEPRRAAPFLRAKPAAPAAPGAPETASAPAAPIEPTALSSSPAAVREPVAAATSTVFAPETSRAVPRAPVMPSLHPAPPPPATAAAPPVVEIHIGSIEVRAAAALAPPAPPSASAGLSLDAFLAQGNGR